MWYIIAGLVLALGVFSALAVRMGFSPRRVLQMARVGAHTAMPIVVILLTIGMVTGSWRGAGTIVGFVDYGVRLITPRLFLLVAFLVTCVMSYALGTSFGVAGTAGVIFMALARSGNVNPVITAGVLMSGIFFGDRGSPVSSTAVMTANLTGTELMGNVRRMAKSALLPMAVCLAVYAVLSVRNPIGAVDRAVIAAFDHAFSLTPWVFLPAALLLILPLFHVPILLCMGGSILSAVLVGHFAQGAGWGELLKTLALGYKSPDPALAAILNGGGVISMLDTCLIFALACTCSGVFNGTGMLHRLEERISALSGRVGTFPLMIATSLLGSAIFCNQVIAIVLCSTFFRPVFDRLGRSREDLALDMENICITVPAFVPWSIICSVPLKLFGADYRSMLYAVFLYAVPLIGWAQSARRAKKKQDNNEANS